MSQIPYRTGITTVKKLLRKICDILITYNTVIKSVTPANKHIYIDALMQACEDFITEVPNPRP